jgi:hypothetical protein
MHIVADGVNYHGMQQFVVNEMDFPDICTGSSFFDPAHKMQGVDLGQDQVFSIPRKTRTLDDELYFKVSYQ